MAVIDIKKNPTRRELYVFGLLVILFFGVLALMAMGRPRALVGGAVFTGVCLLVSLAFNSDYPRVKQLWAVLVPALLLGLGMAERWGAKPAVVAICVATAGFVAGVVVLAWQRAARRAYSSWMMAVMPIGWTVSTVVLALVFYLVVTPVGLLKRMFTKDTMQRKLDRSAKSYWTPHQAVDNVNRYFRQY